MTSNKQMATNLLFMFCDMIEKCFTVMRENGWTPEKIPDKFERKHFKELEYWTAIIRQKTADMELSDQCTFGEESDHLFKLMLTALDRTGYDMRAFGLIQNYAEAFESKLNLKLNKFGI